MPHLLGISGSLRRASYNTALLQAASALAASPVTFEIATLHGIPLYDGDREQAEGLPDAVSALKARIAAADGVILATPEYNNGIPGVFKNAIDWLSRPASGIPTLFGNRAFALIGASPGGFGTLSSQSAWLPVLRTLGVRQWNGGRLLVARAGEAFDAEGALVDEATRRRLSAFVADFAAFARTGDGTGDARG
ncbi:NADPH-dependent FMN reductase [Luteimonas abyssi]|uniref:NADPH-dependent FMN reductase n=1 Tax=Luteimonas abyssi TaxID=1247514 RepID=UPI000737CE02|nr:NADPH-dependent FMN reductase [Luteimonas abyssi]